MLSGGSKTGGRARAFVRRANSTRIWAHVGRWCWRSWNTIVWRGQNDTAYFRICEWYSKGGKEDGSGSYCYTRIDTRRLALHITRLHSVSDFNSYLRPTPIRALCQRFTCYHYFFERAKMILSQRFATWRVEMPGTH